MINRNNVLEDGDVDGKFTGRAAGALAFPGIIPQPARLILGLLLDRQLAIQGNLLRSDANNQRLDLDNGVLLVLTVRHPHFGLTQRRAAAPRSKGLVGCPLEEDRVALVTGALVDALLVGRPIIVSDHDLRDAEHIV